MPPDVREKLQYWLNVQIADEARFLRYADLDPKVLREHLGRRAGLEMVKRFLGGRFDRYSGHLKKAQP